MNDCGICLTGAEDCVSEFCSASTRTARKEHTCCECGKTIQSGERYERSAGKTDGDIWTFSTCLICAEIANAFYCGARYYGGILWDEMQDYAFAEMTTGCLKRLASAAAKAELMRRWNEWKFAPPSPDSARARGVKDFLVANRA